MVRLVTDRRLAPVFAVLAAGRVKVLSVDIFDTVLWRRVPEPKDVFLLLGRDLGEKRHLGPQVTAIAFAELRHAAEKAARERREALTGYREITLPDVYREFPAFLFAKGFDAVAAAAAEVTFEAGLMIRDRAIADVMAAAKAAGAQVILVSDTYFTSPQIKAFLAKPGLVEGRDFDRLYVSCEAGRPKWRDLFDTVLADMAVPPAAMLHIGDSVEADIWPCLPARPDCGDARGAAGTGHDAGTARRLRPDRPALASVPSGAGGSGCGVGALLELWRGHSRAGVRRLRALDGGELPQSGGHQDLRHDARGALPEPGGRLHRGSP
jgi:FMN phosphatase YigB (HAD superfamily)